jgi:hypothetical protein
LYFVQLSNFERCLTVHTSTVTRKLSVSLCLSLPLPVLTDLDFDVILHRFSYRSLMLRDPSSMLYISIGENLIPSSILYRIYSEDDVNTFPKANYFVDLIAFTDPWQCRNQIILIRTYSLGRNSKSFNKLSKLELKFF